MNELKQNNSGTGFQANKIIVNNFVKNKSNIANIVNALSKINFDHNHNIFTRYKPADIEKKINHNNISKFKYLINEYKIYTQFLDEIYQNLEAEKPGRRDLLLEMVNRLYEQEVASYYDEENINIKKIRDNSDNIIENILIKLREKVLESANLDVENEEMDFAISIIMADLFIRCTILENPDELK